MDSQLDASPPPLPAAAHDATPPSSAAPSGSDDADDLGSDVAGRIRKAKAQFGPQARTRVIGEVFVLVEAGKAGALFDQAAALVKRALPPLFDQRFTRHPDAGVTIDFFASHAAFAAFAAFCAQRAGVAATDNFGVYRRSTREIAVDGSDGAADLPTLTHEIIHPIVETDFPTAPLWIDEALASLFEAPVFSRDGAIHGAARNWRHTRLARALAAPRARERVRLDALFTMSSSKFMAVDGDGGVDKPRRLLNAALARSVAAWLDAEGTLWPFYRAWRDSAVDDPTGEKAFTHVVGMPPADANERWARWAR